MLIVASSHEEDQKRISHGVPVALYIRTLFCIQHKHKMSTDASTGPDIIQLESADMMHDRV